MFSGPYARDRAPAAAPAFHLEVQVFQFEMKDDHPARPHSQSRHLRLVSILLDGKVMTIRVDDSGGGSEQTRAYAEYRVFASLAPYSRLVREVEVVVRANAGHVSPVLCDISVRFDSGRRVNVQARGGHAYEAINRAAIRVSERLTRRGGDVLALPGAS
jgi:hypothetical protein